MTESVKAEILQASNTSLTTELREKLILLAKANPSLTHVASIARVPLGTLRFWIQRGDEGDPRYAALAAGIHEARSGHLDDYIGNLLQVVQSTDPKAYNAKTRASQWLLEKFFPKEFGDQLFVKTMIERDIDGFDLKAVPVDILRDFKRIVDLIKAANEGADPKELQRLADKARRDGPKDPDQE